MARASGQMNLRVTTKGACSAIPAKRCGPTESRTVTRRSSIGSCRSISAEPRKPGDSRRVRGAVTAHLFGTHGTRRSRTDLDPIDRRHAGACTFRAHSPRSDEGTTDLPAAIDGGSCRRVACLMGNIKRTGCGRSDGIGTVGRGQAAHACLSLAKSDAVLHGEPGADDDGT